MRTQYEVTWHSRDDGQWHTARFSCRAAAAIAAETVRGDAVHVRAVVTGFVCPGCGETHDDESAAG